MAAVEQFALKIPAEFASRINWAAATDPLLRQVLPDARESASAGATDPVGELSARVAGGLVHKYGHRALLITSSACDIHCRYCFRRHFPYEQTPPNADRWAEVASYLTEHPEVSELILSGGDPLTLSTRRLASLTGALTAVPQLRRLRIHSRTPLVRPQRIDAPLLRWLESLPWRTVLVLHCNHARELGQAGKEAITQLREAGLTLLNQSVLLAGVNDCDETLAELSETLFDHGVLPYYLHQMDPVQGADHFVVEDERAKALVSALRKRLPGYLVPRLVSDPPASDAKKILA
ncbi:MAG: EF-P beta-lysylation protein EpmB [Pseudomonadota bacterium]